MRGKGRNIYGIGRNRNPFNGGRGGNQGDKPGSGVGGWCVCPKCGNKVAHITNKPCNTLRCPKCGSYMTRE